ncbi:hypothetical protein Pssp01_62440 [Pseudomonas sp. NBRC 100443]|nr:hypothetical protein Pssp01_62440 [Pseudomonas sp. NBRC 100443]
MSRAPSGAPSWAACGAALARAQAPAKARGASFGEGMVGLLLGVRSLCGRSAPRAGHLGDSSGSWRNDISGSLAAPGGGYKRRLAIHA